ncbi:MAG: hypothetical protein JNM27_19805 [Leptospirales bacterium]|nr:hypothetical protein [Leptospirales bacterium]
MKIVIASVLVFIGMNFILLLALPASNVYLDTDLFVWAEKKRSFESNALQIDTLIIGDSQAMSGILPEALARHGIVAYNLAVPSQQPEGMEYTAREIEQRYPAVRSVVVNISPFTLFKSEVWPAFLNYYKETYDPGLIDVSPTRVPLSGKNAGDMIYRGLHVLPIFKFRDRLAPLIAHATPFEFAAERARRNREVGNVLDSQKGYWVWQSKDSFKCNATIESVPPLASLKYPERPESVPGYERLILNFKQQSIKVTLVFIPLSDVWAGLAAPGTEGRVHQAMQRLETLGARIVPMPARSEYSGLFHDWTHLNYCGAKKYSDWLAGQLVDQAR